MHNKTNINTDKKFLHSHTTTAPLLQNPPPPPLLPAGHDSSDHRNLTTSIMLATASWLRMRWTRCFFLLLCSPILLPVLCATFPILCAAEFCLRFCRRRRRRRRKEEEGDDVDDRIRRCEEGFCDCDENQEVGLLQRYLDDQLKLVRSVYECGGDDDFDFQEFDFDYNNNNNITINSNDLNNSTKQNLDSKTTPLLS